MTRESIFHLEPFDQFTRRVVDLNRFHSPEDPLHAVATDAAASPEVAAVRKGLAAIHKNFPTSSPLADQGAYLLRAFAGLRLFAEANYRTGWDFLGEVLAHDSHAIVADLHEAQDLGASLWEMTEGLEAAGLGDQDEAYSAARHFLHHHLA